MDKWTGEAIQIDFGVLFDEGKLLKVPEIVPFRLTPCIVDAFGVTKIEGVYRRVCEITMDILRENKDLLLNILESFVHDPLVSSRQSSGMVDPNEILHVVDRKLGGYVVEQRPNNGSTVELALNVQALVQKLIFEATNSENLSKMYIGFASWL